MKEKMGKLRVKLKIKKKYLIPSPPPSPPHGIVFPLFKISGFEKIPLYSCPDLLDGVGAKFQK